MSIVSGLVIYACVWSMVLFFVLPFGTTRGNDPYVPGQDAGAPDQPRMIRKFIQTSFIALGVFALIYVAIAGGLLDFYIASSVQD